MIILKIRKTQTLNRMNKKMNHKKKDEGSLKKLFKCFKLGVIDFKTFLEDTKISRSIYIL